MSIDYYHYYHQHGNLRPISLRPPRRHDLSIRLERRLWNTLFRPHLRFNTLHLIRVISPTLRIYPPNNSLQERSNLLVAVMARLGARDTTSLVLHTQKQPRLFRPRVVSPALGHPVLSMQLAPLNIRPLVRYECAPVKHPVQPLDEHEVSRRRGRVQCRVSHVIPVRHYGVLNGAQNLASPAVARPEELPDDEDAVLVPRGRHGVKDRVAGGRADCHDEHAEPGCDAVLFGRGPYGTGGVHVLGPLQDSAGVDALFQLFGRQRRVTGLEHPDWDVGRAGGQSEDCRGRRGDTDVYLRVLRRRPGSVGILRSCLLTYL